MENTRVAIIAIIVEDNSVINSVQALLTEYSEYIIGRMGIPYKEKNVKIISVVLDAPADIINALTGKIGKLKNVSAKTVYSKV
ncbi:iron-only hydrogenase system regulator [bacterium]|nr:iron-only hydrogenase system regulator [bacterium]